MSSVCPPPSDTQQEHCLPPSETSEKPSFVAAHKTVLLGLGAAFCFSIMVVCVKLLGDFPVQETVLARSLINSLAIIATFAWSLSRQSRPFQINQLLGKPSNRLLLVARALSGYVALSLYFFSIEELHLGQAALIQYISPLFAAILAFIFLRESLSPKLLFSFLLCLLGISLITHLIPWDSTADHQITKNLPWLSFFAAIMSAFLSACAYLLVRKISLRGENPNVIIFYFSTVSIIPSLILSLVDFVMPSAQQLLWLGLGGFMAYLGQVFLTYALQIGPTATASKSLYVAPVFASTWGFIIFGESITWQFIAGATCIIMGLLFLQDKASSPKP